MSPRQQPSSGDTGINSLLRGILYGLAFFIPGVVLVMHAGDLRSLIEGVSQLPVIKDISRDFQTGLEVAGELFLERSELFYGRDTTIVLTEDSNLPYARNASFAWRRTEVANKLELEFGNRKMKSANRFLDYIEQSRSLAVQEMVRSRIPASIKLAQGLLESNAGASRLATSTNNHFGIKCRQRKGMMRDGRIDDQDFYHHQMAIGCFQSADDNEWDRFEMYESIDDSYRRHSNLLTQSKRYNWMISAYHTGQDYEVSKEWFNKTSVPYYAAWAIGLKQSGYATSKRYAQKLAYIIETYELWRVDYEAVFAI